MNEYLEKVMVNGDIISSVEMERNECFLKGWLSIIWSKVAKKLNKQIVSNYYLKNLFIVNFVESNLGRELKFYRTDIFWQKPESVLTGIRKSVIT